MLDVWNKAVLYHFIHAIALFALALYGTANRGAWWLLFAGILLFSGSLYVMALIRSCAGSVLLLLSGVFVSLLAGRG